MLCSAATEPNPTRMRARLAFVFRDLLISARPVSGGVRLLFRSRRRAPNLRDGDDRTNKNNNTRAQYYCRRICRRRPRRSDRGRRPRLHGRKYGVKSRRKQRFSPITPPRRQLVSCHQPNDGRVLSKNRGSLSPAVKDLLKFGVRCIPLVRMRQCR